MGCCMHGDVPNSPRYWVQDAGTLSRGFSTVCVVVSIEMGIDYVHCRFHRAAKRLALRRSPCLTRALQRGRPGVHRRQLHRRQLGRPQLHRLRKRQDRLRQHLILAKRDPWDWAAASTRSFRSSSSVATRAALGGSLTTSSSSRSTAASTSSAQAHPPRSRVYSAGRWHIAWLTNG